MEILRAIILAALCSPAGDSEAVDVHRRRDERGPEALRLSQLRKSFFRLAPRHRSGREGQVLLLQEGDGGRGVEADAAAGCRGRPRPRAPPRRGGREKRARPRPGGGGAGGTKGPPA